MKKINSKIIAQLAGVSRSTVSRVINNYPDISPETKEKVLKVIEENGYYPNLSAKKLAGKKSGIIGLFVYTGKSSTNEKNYKKISESLYYSELISKIIDAAENLGYLVLVSYINKKGTTWEKIFANGIIDGALVISGGKKFKEIENLINSKNKIVLLDYEKNVSNTTVSAINPNHFEGGYKATQYLIENGHRNILHLTGEIKRKTS
ncbi:MAG: LacI family DNA-binding transcriptional regulator, partial [Fusobacterium varium]|nr:LacI family DNA-binding transcriptional regulator [Fusobacterium varium]